MQDTGRQHETRADSIVPMAFRDDPTQAISWGNGSDRPRVPAATLHSIQPRARSQDPHCRAPIVLHPQTVRFSWMSPSRRKQADETSSARARPAATTRRAARPRLLRGAARWSDGSDLAGPSAPIYATCRASPHFMRLRAISSFG